MPSKKRKALGQHYLRDRKALTKILRIIDPHAEETIIEIGAGKGVLTFPLAQKAGKVIALEKDKKLIPFLEDKKLKNTTILEGDVLRISFQTLLAPKEKAKLAGNLPYSISSPILFKVAEAKSLFLACFFLLQKEVALRITASPGNKSYAPLSIFFQNYFETRLHFFLPPAAFVPPPKVDSAFISLVLRKTPQYTLEDENDFLQFLKIAFRHRRKKLINNLITSDRPPHLLKEILLSCGIEDHLRAEQIPLKQFVFLYQSLAGSKPDGLGGPS